MTEQEKALLRYEISNKASHINGILTIAGIKINPTTIGALRLIIQQCQFAFDNKITFENLEEMTSKMIEASRLELDFIIEEMKR